MLLNKLIIGQLHHVGTGICLLLFPLFHIFGFWLCVLD